MEQSSNVKHIRQAISLLHDHSTESIATLQKSQEWKNRSPSSTCQGCSAPTHPAGQTQSPAYNQTCFNCQKIGHFTKICWSKPPRQQGLLETTGIIPHSKLSNIHHMASSDPAPLITVNITSANSSSDVKVLLDSDVSISASGRDTGLPQWTA